MPTSALRATERILDPQKQRGIQCGWELSGRRACVAEEKECELCEDVKRIGCTQLSALILEHGETERRSGANEAVSSPTWQCARGIPNCSRLLQLRQAIGGVRDGDATENLAARIQKTGVVVRVTPINAKKDLHSASFGNREAEALSAGAVTMFL